MSEEQGRRQLSKEEEDALLETDRGLSSFGSYASTQMTYNDYLKVPELLSLQEQKSTPPQHDELLFIIIHQTYELWFKQILQELERTIERLHQKQILQGRHFLDRCVQIMKVLVQQIHILETMRPVDFLRFRDLLQPASGFQSIQFRELEYTAGLKNPGYLRFFDDRPDLRERLEKRLAQPDLRDAFYTMLRDLSYDIPKEISKKHLREHKEDHERVMKALVDIYHNPLDKMPLYLLTESMLDFDNQLAHWRDHHVRVVSRIIGMKPGTGGSSGVDYLQRTTRKQCFPQLWEVRTRLSLAESAESTDTSQPS